MALTAGVQPNVLRWARESHGYSIDAVAERFDKDPAIIEAWESGDAAPTYAQLERLAYEVYHRPLAMFFFPEPPEEPTPQQAFRSLPNTELSKLEPSTRYQIRLGQALQTSVKELHDQQNPNPKPIFKAIKLALEKAIPAQAKEVRAFLNIELRTQITWRNDEVALKAWRDAIENAGIYVFKNSFKQKSISGFCLLDPEFPIIYLNNTTTKTRQIFSLLHELAHVLLQTNTVSSFDLPDSQSNEYAKIERFCNAFAAELLMPSTDFNEQIRDAETFSDWVVENLSARYGVSREAVLRRLLDLERVSPEYYNRKAEEWKNQVKAGGGGNVHNNRVAYLGERFLQLVFDKYSQGAITLDQTAQHLGVKAKHVAQLNEILSRRSADA
jgi:Zn-dependent peptidase ImmA (M78 family)